MNTNSNTSIAPSHDPARFFYVGAAILLLGLSILGFQFFYFQGKAYPGRPLTPPIRNVIIAHGVTMTAWMVLLVIQPLWIVTRKLRAHMFWGKIGAILAGCVVFFGVQIAVGAAKVNPPEMKLWGLVPRQFLIIPLSAIFFFALYVAVGVWKRRKPEVHRAMMLLGTLMATIAAIDRIGPITSLYANNIWGATFGPFFPILVIGAVFVFVKWLMTRSVDRPFLVGYIILVAVGPLTMKLATTSLWETVAGFLMG